MALLWSVLCVMLRSDADRARQLIVGEMTGEEVATCEIDDAQNDAIIQALSGANASLAEVLDVCGKVSLAKVLGLD